MRKGSRLYMGGAVVVFVLAYLMVSGFGAGSVYYYTAEEYLDDPVTGQFVRVHGVVMPETLDWRADGPELRFDLGPQYAADAPAAARGAPSFPVYYPRVKPDLLAEGAEVVVEGTMVDGVFEARRVLVKCPSKYEARVD